MTWRSAEHSFCVVADREHFVYQEDVRIQMGGNGKGQTHRHPAGIAFDRGVDRTLNPGESDYFIELPIDLPFVHAEDCTVEENIVDLFTTKKKSRQSRPVTSEKGGS